MNILMVTERYIPIWGGAENQLRQLIPRLAEKGCKIRVVTRRWHSTMPRIENLDNTLVVRLGIPGTGKLATMLFVVALLCFVVRNRKKIDILHSHGAVNMGALCSLLSNLLGKTNVAKIATAGRILPHQKTYVGRCVLKFFSSSGAIISMTDEIDNELDAINISRERVIRITNGVDGNRFKPLNRLDRKLIRDELGVDGQAKLILFSSRLVVRKGLDTLIDAWPKILAKHHDAVLLVLGSGDDQPDSVEDDIKEFVENTGQSGIVFLGESSSPERFCGISDVFVFPSRREGFPNALLEAMTTGLPVVASRIGGVTDIVTSDHLGLLFRPDDSDDLAEKILLIIDNNQKASGCCEKRRDYMLDNFSFELIASKYYALYQRLIGL